jgi:ubiquinone/menaquinone biosynthesis C-methylase UbiE
MSLADRVLEPEVMDSREEAIDYDAMDHADVNRRFVSDFFEAWPPDAMHGALVLDLGTGTAQIPIALCQTRQDLRVLGIDLAEQMLHVGRENVARAGLQERIELRQVDAKRLPFADGSFAAVISNSIVHHIPHPTAVLSEAWRVLAAGGVLFVRDLLRPGDEPTLQHLVDTYTAGANAHQRKMFDGSLRAALNLEEIRALAGDLGLSPADVQASSDRHWTLAARKG